MGYLMGHISASLSTHLQLCNPRCVRSPLSTVETTEYCGHRMFPTRQSLLISLPIAQW